MTATFDPTLELVKLIQEAEPEGARALLQALVDYTREKCRAKTALEFFEGCRSPEYHDQLEAILKADLPPCKGVLTADGLLALREIQLVGRMAQASEECLSTGDSEGAAQYCWAAANALVYVASRATVRAALLNTGNDLAEMTADADLADA